MAVAGLAVESARGRNALLAAFVARTAVGQGALVAGPITVRSQEEGNDVAFDGTVEGVVHRMMALEADPGTKLDFAVSNGSAPAVEVVRADGTRMSQARTN